MRIVTAMAALSALILSACSGTTTLPAPPESRAIDTPGMEAYVTNHNGFTRARATLATDAADKLVLQAFDTTGKHAGYANLFGATALPPSVQIEVIAQMDGDRPTRILRMTADQAPFDNLDARNALIAGPDSTQTYHFRGDATVYASINGGPLLTGYSRKDTNLQVDFARESVNLQLRTGVNTASGSELRSEIIANDLPFDIVGGTYGGPITIRIWAPDSADIYEASGQLRANITADNEALRNYRETMTTSGLFTADGKQVSAQGVFWGTHPNAR